MKKAKRDEKDKKKKEFDIRSRKSSANTVFQPQYAEQLTNIFFNQCVNATEIGALGSLLVLYRVNHAADTLDRDFFVVGNGQRPKDNLIRKHQEASRSHQSTNASRVQADDRRSQQRSVRMANPEFARKYIRIIVAVVSNEHDDQFEQMV